MRPAPDDAAAPQDVGVPVLEVHPAHGVAAEPAPQPPSLPLRGGEADCLAAARGGGHGGGGNGDAAAAEGEEESGDGNEENKSPHFVFNVRGARGD